MLSDETRKAQLEKACGELSRINVHLATRVFCGEVVLYREPKPRYKRDGTRAQQQVNPWADLDKDQAKALAFLLLHSIGNDLAGKLYSENTEDECTT